MFNPVVNALVLFAVGLVAGTLNVIAGGGSLLTLPVMIFLGLPPTVANGTNRVAILVQNVGASWSFQRILALVMVLVAAYTVWRPTPAAGGEATPPPRGSRALLFAGAFFLVGLYGGFLQAGVGFVILAVTTAGGLDLVRGNAVKVALVLAFTPLALAAGNLLGGLTGVRLQILKGHAWVRNVVTVTIVLFAIKLLISG